MEEILVLPYIPSWAQKESRDNVNQQVLSKTLGALPAALFKNLCAGRLHMHLIALGIVLCEVTQTQKDYYHMYSPISGF